MFGFKKKDKNNVGTNEFKRPPMFNKPFMAHGMGSLKGYRVTNLEEALRVNYIKGFRYFEVDLTPTEDDRLVCTHGWREKDCLLTGMEWKPEFEHMTHELFMKQTIHGYPVMDAERLLVLMQEFKDIYLEIDLKTLDRKKSEYTARLILDVFGKDQSVLDRLLIQVNTEEMFFGIDSVYHFAYYQFNIRNDIDKLDKYIAFCKKHGICALALKGQHVTVANMKKIKENNLCTLVYTVDSRSRSMRYHNRGVDTICTNLLQPGGISKQKDDYINLFFNSNGKVSSEKISELKKDNILRGELYEDPFGNLEYMEVVGVLDQFSFPLMKCPFEIKGKRFAGWQAKGKRSKDESWFFFCKDSKWHTMEEIKENNHDICIFEDKQVVRLDKMFHRERIVFSAIWEDEA